MDWFKYVRDNYNVGNYTKDNVKVFVVKLKITPEQYEEITGEAY